jgi:hypothetical protein
MKCPMCGNCNLESGWAAGHYPLKFKSDKSGLIDSLTVFGGWSTHAQRCTRCGFLAIFAPECRGECQHERRIVLTMRRGKVIEDPALKDLRAAVAELNVPGLEFPGFWLSTPDGWTLTFYENGLAALEKDTGDAGPWHINSVSHEKALEMSQILLHGDIESLRSQPWIDG